MLIVKPAFLDRNIVYLIALLGTSFNGLAFVLNKYLQRPGGDSAIDDNVLRQCRRRRLQSSGSGDDSATRARGLALAVRRVLLFGPMGMYLGLVAIRHASASALGPYTFLRLVIAVVAGLVFFHETPDVLSCLGVAAILVSCLLASTAPREADSRAVKRLGEAASFAQGPYRQAGYRSSRQVSRFPLLRRRVSAA